MLPPVCLQADIWSCGVIVYMLLSGEAPFFDPDNEVLERLVLRQNPCVLGGQWDHISLEAKDCVLQMLVRGRAGPARRCWALLTCCLGDRLSL
jgi:serine/threonine protein kinase